MFSLPTLAVAAIAALAGVTQASPTTGGLMLEVRNFPWLDIIPIEKRQVDGAEYQCHADCGYSILDATGGYCGNATYVDQLNRCLSCADTYGLWSGYGPKVSSAATACGWDVAPGGSVPAPGSGSPTTSEAPAAEPTTTAAPPPATTSEAEETAAETTTAAPAKTTAASSAASAPVSATKSSAAASSSASASGAAPSKPVEVSGAARFGPAAAVFVAAFALLF